jgi:hypothetical protein
MFFLVILLVVVLQHIYLYIFYNNPIDITENKEVFSYTLYHENHDLTVYKCGNLQSNKILFILSGSYMLCFDTYVQKMVSDLLVIDYIKNNYQIIIIEKINKSSIVMYDDISKYLLHLNDQIKIEELTILGFSSGGVIASHALALLKSLNCKKQIITYDTPYQVMENVLSFENNQIYRLDYYLYSVVYKTYKNHYNYDKIKDFVRYDKLTNGATDFIKMIKQIHNFSDEEMYFRTGFNFDQDKDTKIINMYSVNDPIINRLVSMKYIECNKKEFNVIHDTISAISHCSDMWSPNIRILKYLLY